MIALKDRDLFRQQALIGGNWRDANLKATADVIDPASQKVLGTIPDMGRDETSGCNRRCGRCVQALEEDYSCRTRGTLGALV